jgi:hypothetical protein
MVKSRKRKWIKRAGVRCPHDEGIDMGMVIALQSLLETSSSRWEGKSDIGINYVLMYFCKINNPPNNGLAGAVTV